jgi:hypothetical protein
MRRYPSYPAEVNDLLDFAREVRRFARQYPDYANPADIMQHVERLASDWGWDLLDLVLDLEERQARFVALWRKWRKRPRTSATK